MKSPSAADFLSVESVILFFIGCLVVNILITANVLPNYMLLFSQGRSNMYLGADYLPAQKTEFYLLRSICFRRPYHAFDVISLNQIF